MGIANALIKARNELGLTQTQLSDQSGISRSAIKGYETGRNMPGSRELKALCMVLKVSPNQLLFGTETPFDGETGFGTGEAEGFSRLMFSDPVDAKVTRARVAILAALLTSDEVNSLLNLVKALAVARHGAEVVKQNLEGADLLAGMGATFQKQLLKAKKGEEMSSEEIEADIEAHMAAQGHLPAPPKGGAG